MSEREDSSRTDEVACTHGPGETSSVGKSKVGGYIGAGLALLGVFVPPGCTPFTFPAFWSPVSQNVTRLLGLIVAAGAVLGGIFLWLKAYLVSTLMALVIIVPTGLITYWCLSGTDEWTIVWILPGSVIIILGASLLLADSARRVFPAKQERETAR